jgi:hypothetical protein
MNSITLLSTADVDANLHYLVPMAEKPIAYNYQPPPGIPQRTGEYAPRLLPIRDARVLAGPLSLDEQGFVLRSHQSAVRNFYDQAALREVYYPEVERLVKDLTGAVEVLVFDHTLRKRPQAREKSALREPVQRVHNDYTVNSGPQRVRDLLPSAQAETRLKSRFAEINLWRPIKGPVEDMPLAVCDARSIAPEDLVATDLRYPDRTGETYSVTFNPLHRWFYFPRMQVDEVLFIKCYDSLTDGTARFTAHSAFDDPTTPADAAPRESIEVRTLAFFAPEQTRSFRTQSPL